MDVNKELDEIYRAIVHWGIPLILIAAIHYLQQISKRLNEISLSLAMVVTRLEMHQKEIENHDRRISQLESRRG